MPAADVELAGESLGVAGIDWTDPADPQLPAAYAESELSLRGVSTNGEIVGVGGAEGGTAPPARGAGGPVRGPEEGTEVCWRSVVSGIYEPRNRRPAV
ncbi:MAG: hypothetical protein GF346_06460 [Candidatus Eisenbacteria bacterium]|nr:hypothetical protein [Candidatus Latescibacterota bacterium]MBD3302069.1 hypothetical protein [Candidatus Eisenbacteria bacterium]